MDPILVISGVKGDTRRYRAFHPCEQLQILGAPARLAHVTDFRLAEKLKRARIVIFHRTPYDVFIERLANIIHDLGSLAIFDIDDLIFDVSAFRWIGSPDFRDPVRAKLYQEDMRRQRATLDRCQAAIASTNFLAESVRSTGKPTWVHRNAFSLEMLAISEEAYQNKKTNGGTIVIGYASGTPTHDHDFAMIKPSLMRVLKEYRQTELWIIGPVETGKDWGSLEERIKRYKMVPWRRLPQLLTRFDINIAPLMPGNPFSQSKSEIKYLEAGLVRTPTIASRTDAFEYAIRPGENGHLASDEEQWTMQLSQLITELDFRLAMGQQAYHDVIQRYHPGVRAIELETTLNEIHQQFYGTLLQIKSEGNHRLTSYPATVTLNHRLSPSFERNPSYIKRGIYTLRYRGLQTLAGQIWIYLRRFLAPIFPYSK